jgi:hypothetical protein
MPFGVFPETARFALRSLRTNGSVRVGAPVPVAGVGDRVRRNADPEQTLNHNRR